MTTRSGSTALVSAFFASPAAAEEALLALETTGMPRDLIEIAVSREGVASYRGRVRRAPERQTIRYAGVGGLVGLVFGSAVALLMLAWPGRAELDETIFAQLLGPNVSTVVGAMIGAAVGMFVHRKIDARLERARDAGRRVLVAAYARTEDEATSLAELLRRSGGESPRIDEAA